MEIVYRRKGAKGSLFQLHSGEVEVVDAGESYVYQGADGITRELVVRHGFKYARGADREWAEKLLNPPKKKAPAKKAAPKAKAPAKKAPAKKAASKK